MSLEWYLTYLIHSRNDRSNIVTTLGFEPRTSYTLGGCLTYCAIRHHVYDMIMIFSKHNCNHWAFLQTKHKPYLQNVVLKTCSFQTFCVYQNELEWIIIEIDTLLHRDTVDIRISSVVMIVLLLCVFTPSMAVLMLCNGVLFSLHE